MKNWWSSTYRRIYVSHHLDDSDPRYLALYDLEHMEKQILSSNTQVALIGARCHVGNCYYNTRIGHKHEGLGSIDLLAEMTTRLHRHNLKVPVYFSCIWDRRSYNEHPDWRQITSTGVPAAQNKKQKSCCPNSPYRDYARALVEEIVAGYDIDGIMFDMVMFDALGFAGEELVCYCQYCRELFRSLFGKKLPVEVNWDDPNFLQFIQFRYESIYRFVQHLVAGVKGHRPDIPVYLQYLPMKGNWAMGQSERLAELVDFLLSDIYFISGYLRMSVDTRLMRSIMQSKPFEVHLMGRPGKHDDAPNMKTLDHLRAEAFTILANGGSVGLFDIMWSHGKLQDEMWARFGKIHSEIKQREPWLGGKPLQEVGLYFSESSRDYFGKDQPEDRYMDEFYGIARILLEEHIPFEILTERQFRSETPDFKVIILPNAACLSDADIISLRKFVERGGVLFATGYTSLFDEKGAIRDDFGLADIMGVHYNGQFSYSRTYLSLDNFELDSEITGGLNLLTNWGPQLEVIAKNARVLGTTALPFIEANNNVYASPMANPPAIFTRKPFLTRHQYSKGKIVYIANLMGKNYAHIPFVEIRQLMGHLLRSLVSGKFSVEAQAPPSVEMNVYRTLEEDNLIIHLVNLQSEAGRNYITTRGESRHLIQEVIPVDKLKIHVSSQGKKVEQILLQPDGLLLEHERTDGGIEIHVPRLHVHCIIVVEWRRES